MRSDPRRSNMEHMRGVHFHDKWEDDFDKSLKRMMGLTAVVWAVSITVSLVFTGVIIWAIIKLVQHFTGA